MSPTYEYTGMTFVCCQLAQEWCLYVATLRGNDICVLPACTGMVFVCGHLTWEWRLCVASLTDDCV